MKMTINKPEQILRPHAYNTCKQSFFAGRGS